MLYYTGVSIECLSDPDMVAFLEQNIRGGVSFIGQRYYKTDPEPSDNGKKDNVAERKERATGLYLDMNNLYMDTSKLCKYYLI